MELDDILRVFWARPAYQRLFLALTVGVFLSCGASVASAQASGLRRPPSFASPSWAPATAPGRHGRAGGSSSVTGA